jgi:hypothetical protein
MVTEIKDKPLPLGRRGRYLWGDDSVPLRRQPVTFGETIRYL